MTRGARRVRGGGRTGRGAKLRSCVYCALLTLFSLNAVLVLSKRTRRRSGTVEEIPLSGSHHSPQQVSDAVQKLRGHVSAIEDRQMADAAWTKITELNEWLKRQEKRDSRKGVSPRRGELGAALTVQPQRHEETTRSSILDASTCLLVICYERSDVLARCLASVARYHPCGGSPVVVSQDGTSRANGEIERAVDDFKTALESRCGEELVYFKRNDAQTNSGGGYHKLARHFKFALGETFRRPGIQRTIVLEEDLVVASDFFEYFAGVSPLLDSDGTLLAASAWNDNGQTGRVKDAKRIVRSDFFPGLGWMLTEKVWRELEAKWPGAYWDDWLREPQQRKGRHILRPEICRTYHQVSSGGTSNNQYSEFLTKIQLYDGSPVAFSSSSGALSSSLRLDNYDARFREDLRLASPISLSGTRNLESAVRDAAAAAGLAAGCAVRVEYDGLDDRQPSAFPALARRLGIMDNIKAGVPRTAYRGVVDFWLGDFHVYLSPPFHQVESALFRLS